MRRSMLRHARLAPVSDALKRAFDPARFAVAAAEASDAWPAIWNARSKARTFLLSRTFA